MVKYFIFYFLQIALFSSDFDCIIVGSSPFSLFEALYQSNLGKKVLILEEAEQCGGAWKGIDVCGVLHADLGCHQIGNDLRLKSFLEKYAGCQIVSLDNPTLPFDESRNQNGWYFSHGCYELIENLLKLIEQTDTVVLTNTKAETAQIDILQKMATVETKERSYTTDLLIITPQVTLKLQPFSGIQIEHKSKHYHLYLLIQDPTPPRFTFRGKCMNGVSRMMNLTHFVNLVGSGRQLIAVQIYKEQSLEKGQMFLDELKAAHLLDQSAYILESQSYIYESGAFHQGIINAMGAEEIVEVLQTGHFKTMLQYLDKWEAVLKPLI